MRIKDDTVSFQSLAPQLVLALWMVQEVYDDYHADLVITSCNDSKHSTTSLHYSGNAVDLRIWDFKDKEAEVATMLIKKKLNQDFDVILETDHIHLEYQPKKR